MQKLFLKIDADQYWRGFGGWCRYDLGWRTLIWQVTRITRISMIWRSYLGRKVY